MVAQFREHPKKPCMAWRVCELLSKRYQADGSFLRSHSTVHDTLTSTRARPCSGSRTRWRSRLELGRGQLVERLRTAEHGEEAVGRRGWGRACSVRRGQTRASRPEGRQRTGNAADGPTPGMGGGKLLEGVQPLSHPTRRKGARMGVGAS